MKYWKAILASAIIVAPCAPSQADDSWRLGVDGGVTLYSGEEDARFASISIARDFEQGYFQLGVSMVDGGVTQGVADAVPVKSETVTLSGGRIFGDIIFDGYASLGQRRFNPGTLPGGRVTINTDGSSFAAGGALTYDIALSNGISLSPFVALDYDEVDVGRAIILPGGDVRTVKSKEDGITGSAGASLQKLFGNGGAHSVGLNAAFVATSNSSSTHSGTGTNTISRIVAARNVSGQSDQWAELGTSASFAISETLRLNLNANRTTGFSGPEAMTITAGLSVNF